MPNEIFPPDALFINIGWFQAGAFGRLAIIALAGLLLIYLGDRLGWWR